MTPIVSPWFIYFLGVIDIFNFVLGFTTIILGIAILVFIVASMGMKVEAEGEYGTDSDKKWEEYWRKLRKKCLPIFLIVLVLAIITPSKNTLIAMYVTKFVTTDNVTKAIEAGGNFKDVVKKDIIEIIEAMKGEKAQSEKSKDNN